ncbi:hypothetical protein HJC23_006876 [Cyclotella cryptica]|uniref:Cyclin N-terminal domain-containing protein n=1 Tax=Cyclotella cryptica TaxID=29204 RepID=A0ABD3QBW5_9STRA|eukprot:CCRYP_006698-RA/>CCRYP_006698-RA protein AED:0.02 eAED:0.02 QI:245/1/1/1/1/1/2/207/444
MKFRFFNRRITDVNAPGGSDRSSIDESEVCPLSSRDQSTRNSELADANDETMVVMSLFECNQISDDLRMGKATTTVSTICSMIESECNDSAYDPSRNHLYFSDQSDNQGTAVDEKCRSKMLEWCFKMVDFFNIDRSIVSLATSYQDRFLSTAMGLSARTCRETFRIASVTCLYIAIKLYVPHKWNVTAHAFAQLCRGTISGESIVEMEMRVLFALEWNVHPPIPMSYVELILDLIAITTANDDIEPRQNTEDLDEDSVIGDLILPCLSDSSLDHSAGQECTKTSVRENVIELVRYQIEISLRNVNFLCVRSSVLSLAALLNAIEGIINGNEASAPTVISFCRESVAAIAKIMSCSNVCSKRELDEVRAALLCLVMAMPGGKIESSTLHYSSPSEGHRRRKSPQCSVITSPTSTSSWNQNGELDHFLSPQSLLSRVCAMHCQVNI